ncbi:MAG: hypothetical protein ABIH23_00820 [bacterium]
MDTAYSVRQTTLDVFARHRTAHLAETHAILGLLQRRAACNHGGCQVEWRREGRIFRVPWQRCISPPALSSAPSADEAGSLVDVVLIGLVEALVGTLKDIAEDPLDMVQRVRGTDFFVMPPCANDHPWRRWAAREGVTVGQSAFVPQDVGFLFPEKALEMRYMTPQAVMFDSYNGTVRAEAYFAPVFQNSVDVVAIASPTKFEILVARSQI